MAHALRLTDKAAWRLVACAYLAVFGAILWSTQGLPYAIDNNESFSSLLHAHSLHDVSWGLTKGLADEAAAWHPGASPYVHTHQGNVPRVFAFLLYSLGARSVESQIFLTTFTVGLLAVWFLFRLLRTVGPPSFAMLGCIVMISDYGLFGQWQVNTYRVWYGFFFFSSFLWVRAAGTRCGRGTLALGILNFSAMFYGEYVFATFVATACALYACVLYRAGLPTLVRVAVAEIAGACIAGGTLLAQLTAYMGWENVRRDIRYTLSARNMAFDQAFSDEANRFYAERHIVFFQNYLDVTEFRHLGYFLRSLFTYHLQFYSSTICVPVLILLAGCLAGLARRRAAPGSRKQGLVSWAGAARTLACVAATAGIVMLRGPLFGARVEGVWPLAPWVSSLDGAALLSASAVVAAAVAGIGARRALGGRLRIPGIALFAACVLLGYAFVYRIFTGYVFSGYLHRQAPFLVFLTDILVACAVFSVFEAARRMAHRGCRIAAVFPAVLVLALGFSWVTLQAAYWRILPATQFSFLKALAKPPYRGGTFVASTYAAPIALETHAWAYPESSIFSGDVRLGADGFVTERDLKYCWFADAATNPAYLKPDFGLEVSQPASITEALEWYREGRSEKTAKVAFESIGTVNRSLHPIQAFLSDRIMASDGARYTILRFDWDFPPYLRPIDEEIANSARRMTLRQRIAVSQLAEAYHRHWRVEIEPLRISPPAPPVPLDLLLTATVDGRSLLPPGAMDADGAQIRLVEGDRIRVALKAQPDGGRVRVAINDMARVFDLGLPSDTASPVLFSSNEPYGEHTAIPNFPPGIYARTELSRGAQGTAARVAYRYAQQDHVAEGRTTVRIYSWDTPGDMRLVDSITFLGAHSIPIRLAEFRRRNPDTLVEYARVSALGDPRNFDQWLLAHLEANPQEMAREGIVRSGASTPVRMAPQAGKAYSEMERTVPLPHGLSMWTQLSVTPGTLTKDGPEYRGLPFSAGDFESSGQAVRTVGLSAPAPYAGELPFGALRLRLRFPKVHGRDSEPVVTTGIEDAGDMLYVGYPDASHVRFGFDHWFYGGPITPPIAVDYSKEHTVEVSMGSLFPSPEDFIFQGVPAAAVERAKSTLRVTLDGVVVLDSRAKFYDATPEQVTAGRNLINGTTEIALFNGQILEQHRVWPSEAHPLPEPNAPKEPN